MHTQSSQCLSYTLAQIKDYPDGDAGKILDYYLRESLKNSILSFSHLQNKHYYGFSLV